MPSPILPQQQTGTHTPGPWVADPPEAFGPDGHAGVWHEESGGPICWVGDPYPRGDNHPVENMRLIAAAPEQLAALEAAYGHDVGWEALAEAAIAKARGA